MSRGRKRTSRDTRDNGPEAVARRRQRSADRAKAGTVRGAGRTLDTHGGGVARTEVRDAERRIRRDRLG